ncbi:hypothetical protein Tco_0089377 [Tanacetum coccineum]
MFNVPLGNSDSISRSIKTSDLRLEKLTTEIGLDDSIPTKIDESSSVVSPAFLPTESSLLVTPPPDLKQICLREVERFDPLFSQTQSGEKTRVIKTTSFGFHHMPSPRPAAYSPKEVMYRYYHPHLTSGDGFDHGLKMK